MLKISFLLTVYSAGCFALGTYFAQILVENLEVLRCR